jgi:Spy/CpxP family protein refolding chaperone
MKRVNLRNILSTAVVLGTTIATTAALAQPSQGGNGPGYGMGPGMMDGYGTGWMGGYGGIWVPILVVVAVAGLVAWIVRQKRK